jgi:predicted amidohydrolase YtcJ
MASRVATIIVVVIVAATLVAGLIVRAQRDDEGPVDLLVFNGRVHTGEAGAAVQEAIAVQGNRILKIGTNRELKRLRRAQTVVVDAHGATILPAFNDSHVHFLGGSLALDGIDLLGAKTLEDIQTTIRAYAEANPDRDWVIGRGWFYAPFPGGLPTRQQLDALVPDRPAYLECYDGHTAWVNTKALEIAGITRRTKNPKNGIIVKDPRTGEPTGVLKESAQELVQVVLPKPTRDEQLTSLRRGIALAHRFGVTSIQNASGNAEELELYDELRRAGDLRLRVYSALSIEPGFTESDANAFDALWRKYPDDPLFKTGAVKLMTDGVIEAHTAAMLAPYSNRPTTGIPNYTRQELNRIVAMMDGRGWQIMLHAIGDAGVRMALDALEHAAAVNPPPARGRRHRIEHIETIDSADIPRFARLGVIASQQPLHGTPSPNQITVWAANIGPERASRAWAWQSIAAQGGRLAFGSDWPVVTMDPRQGLQVAVHRTTAEGSPEGGWLPEQKLPLVAAIEAYTRGAAYASFDDQRKGTLLPGTLADIVILSTDLFATPVKPLDSTVETTIFDGRVVYSRDPALATATN